MGKIELKKFNIDEYQLIKTSNVWQVYENKDTFFKEYMLNNNSLITWQRLEKILKNENLGICQMEDFVYKKLGIFENFVGYTVKRAQGKSYRDLYEDRLPLDQLVDIFIDLYNKVKGNEKQNGYVFSDLATRDNVFWDDLQKQNIIIDVDSIQVPGFKPTVISSSIDNTLLNTELRFFHLLQDENGKVDIATIYKNKFYDNNNKIFKPKVNDLSLLVLFYRMATGKNFMYEEIRDCEHFLDGVSNNLLKTGLDEYDVFYRMVLDTVDVTCENKDFFLDSLYQLKHKYELQPILKNPLVKQRKFVIKK